MIRDLQSAIFQIKETKSNLKTKEKLNEVIPNFYKKPVSFDDAPLSQLMHKLVLEERINRVEKLLMTSEDLTAIWKSLQENSSKTVSGEQVN